MRLGARLVLPFCVMVATFSAAAQDYPTRPVRIVVPFAAGNSSDTATRLVAQHLTTGLGQAFVVENKPGAGAILGTDYGAKQPPDGYTLVFGSTGPLAIGPALQPTMPYKLTDLTPIATFAWTPQVFVVPVDSPIKSIPSLVEAAKAKPNDFFYGSSGNGSTQHLMVSNFASIAGIKLHHVPYKGGVAALTDLMAGRISLASDVTSVVLPQIRAGKVRAIGVTTDTRLPQLPDVPTIAEQGVPFNMKSWMTLWAPAGTPEPILNKVASEVARIKAMPEVQKSWFDQGFVMMDLPRDKMMDFAKSEQIEWGRIVKESGAKVD
ncbi:MAG: Bug family tripartite tricarboxylate transporter substrate binding protein [Lautropia sp.]